LTSDFYCQLFNQLAGVIYFALHSQILISCMLG
jgi:hypothetical protein